MSKGDTKAVFKHSWLTSNLPVNGIIANLTGNLWTLATALHGQGTHVTEYSYPVESICGKFVQLWLDVICGFYQPSSNQSPGHKVWDTKFAIFTPPLSHPPAYPKQKS